MVTKCDARGAIVPHGPIEQQRVEEALERLAQQARAYAHSACPRPFGSLQDAIRDAKHAGASCHELVVWLRHLEWSTVTHESEGTGDEHQGHDLCVGA